MRVNPAWMVLLLGACAGGYDINPIAPPPPPPPAPESFHLEVFPFGHGVGMGLGSTLQLSPHIVGVTSGSVAPSAPVAYTSRTPTMVSVNQSGLVTALTMGASTIQASTVHEGQTLTDTLAVSVFCTVELTAVTTPSVSVLLVGEGFTPTIRLTTCGGQITLTNPITWSAMDPNIISVNQDTGETVALRAGVTVLRASASINPSFKTPVAGIQVTVH